MISDGEHVSSDSNTTRKASTDTMHDGRNGAGLGHTHWVQPVQVERTSTNTMQTP